jgi:hypothetical protein
MGCCVYAVYDLFVYIVFALHQIVEPSIPKVASKVVDDIDETFAIDDIANVAPRYIDAMVSDPILQISYCPWCDMVQLTCVKLYVLTLSPLPAPLT